MARLKKLAVAACVVQFLITVGIPLMQFFLVFNSSIQHMHILLVTGVSALIAASLGVASALTRGPTLPALHVVAAILLAALMGSFNTQTYLDLNMQCNVAQSAIVGCTTCPCALTNSCTETLLKAADCSSCKALGTDFCLRVRWQALLLPYTGLIEAVLLAIPGFLSLLLLLQRSNSPTAVTDPGRGDVKVMVNAWPGGSTSEPEDWPSATPAAPPAAKRAPSSKHAALVTEPSWQQQGGGGQQGDMVSDFDGTGLQQEHSAAYLTSSTLGSTMDSQQELAGLAPKKKAPGLKKKLTSKVSAARTDAALM